MFHMSHSVYNVYTHTRAHTFITIYRNNNNNNKRVTDGLDGHTHALRRIRNMFTRMLSIFAIVIVPTTCRNLKFLIFKHSRKPRWRTLARKHDKSKNEQTYRPKRGKPKPCRLMYANVCGNVPNDIAAPNKVANKSLTRAYNKSSLDGHLPWNRMRCNRESLPRKQKTEKKTKS